MGGSGLLVHGPPRRAGVAVGEYPLKWQEGAEIKSGTADYLLQAEGRAIGDIGAKPAGQTFQGVLPQPQKYTAGLDKGVPAGNRPLPFAYESTGEVTQFTNGLDPEPRSWKTYTYHWLIKNAIAKPHPVPSGPKQPGTPDPEPVPAVSGP